MSKKKNHAPREEKNTEPLSLTLFESIDKKDTLDVIIGHYKAWLPKYQELAQGRSNFQIEKIVATEHVTPAASYQHTLFQLRVLHQALINDFVLGIEKTREFEYKWKDKPRSEPQWWHLERGGKKLCWYDTDLLTHEHEMEELKMSVKDKLLQLETFTKVLRSMEEKHQGMFTHEDLNEEEPEYWKLRLARQMVDSYMDRETGLGSGNIKSLRMALSDSPVEGSKNRIEGFPDIFNGVLGSREKALEIMNEVNETLFEEMNALGSQDGEGRLSKPVPQESLPASDAKSAASSGPSELEKLRSVGIGISELED